MKLSDGAELWTTSSGGGPAVLTLHGAPGLGDYFAPIATMIDRSHTVITYLSGVGAGNVYFPW